MGDAVKAKINVAQWAVAARTQCTLQDVRLEVFRPPVMHVLMHNPPSADLHGAIAENFYGPAYRTRQQ